MAEAILHPEWRASHEDTKYPFSSEAAMTNGTSIILEGTFLDAALYPVGGGVRLRLSRVVVTASTATLYIGDQSDAALASGEIDLLSPADTVVLTDTAGRPAGILISEAIRLVVFQSWSVGTHEFTAAQTEFTATVCMPTPEVGLRGIQLADGTLFTGEVWIVGDDGIVVRNETVDVPAAQCGGVARTYSVIRFDAVGDPLFRRRLCAPLSLFATPKFLQQITFEDDDRAFTVTPDTMGSISLTVNNAEASDTVLRIRPSELGLVIEAAGEPMESIL
jgi:hypothetical protein